MKEVILTGCAISWHVRYDEKGEAIVEKREKLAMYRKHLHFYLTERFRKNNHPKYHRYCDEWINNTTIDQLRYFEQEKNRIESGVVLQ